MLWGFDVMTQETDYLYGVSYEPVKVSCKCGKSKLGLYELTATKHFLCLDCGIQFPIEGE